MRSPRFFITGATGNLGREIVPRILLAYRGSEITLLLRGAHAADVRTRLGTLKRYFEAYWPELDTSSVDAVPGDMTLPDLGLDASDARRLHESCTHIVHAAACTHLGLSRDRARSINLGGTVRVLRLAGRCRRLRLLAHVSTAFVAGDRNGVIRETDLDCGQGHRNEYERSKFEAELRVRDAMRQLPIMVLRPSIIVGDSRDGHIASLGTIYQPLRHLASEAGRTIPGDPGAPMDLLPVDIVADLMVDLMRAGRASGQTFHISSGVDNVVPAWWLVECARRYLDSGHDAPTRSPGAGVNGLPHRWRGEPAAGDLAPFFAYLSGHRIFDDNELRWALGSRITNRPHPRHYMARLFEFCRATRWGSDMPWEHASCDMVS